MESTLKCPFCETELEQGIELLRGGHILGCPKCKRNADDIFWKALIQAKQDLEIARKALKEYANKDNWGCIEDDRDRVLHTYWYFDGCDDGGWVKAQKALEQIEHKE